MKLEFKMFNFQGSPVYLKLWFLLLFAWVSPSMVVAIFLSVLVHELAHAFVANRLGYNVRQIYIDLFYGAAEIDLDHCPERDAIQIIGAGPISNLLLGIVSFGLYVGTGIPFLTKMILVNVVLFIFNILPIYPMDGGRILRSLLMMKMSSNRRLAKQISDWVSLIFSIALLAYCIYTSSLMLGIFSLLFIYFALKELKFIK
jgi:stage IV sporulation protein FB